MIVEIFLTVQLLTGDNLPNVIYRQPYDTLEECEQEAARFNRTDPPDTVTVRARNERGQIELREVPVEGLFAGCSGKLGRRMDANVKGGE